MKGRKRIGQWLLLAVQVQPAAFHDEDEDDDPKYARTLNPRRSRCWEGGLSAALSSQVIIVAHLASGFPCPYVPFHFPL